MPPNLQFSSFNRQYVNKTVAGYTLAWKLERPTEFKDVDQMAFDA